MCNQPRRYGGKYEFLFKVGAVTPSGALFVGGALVVREAYVGVRVPCGTYSGSRSSSVPMNIRFDGEIDLECPLE